MPDETDQQANPFSDRRSENHPGRHGEPWECGPSRFYPADILIWAAGQHEPGHATSYYSGQPVPLVTTGLVARLSKEEMARRACDCVNTLRGVDDLHAARELLRDHFGLED